MLLTLPLATPWRWLLALHQAKPAQFPHLLVSALGGRFSILFALPESTEVFYQPDVDFFGHLDAQWQAARRMAPSLTPLEQTLPFRGGWFFYLAYEAAMFSEPTLDLPLPSSPLAILQRFPAAIIYDAELAQSYLFAENADAMQQLVAAFAARPETLFLDTASQAFSQEHFFSEEPPAIFLQETQKILDYIAAGDIFQANLSRVWSMPLPCSVAALLQALLLANPAPFAALATFGDFADVSIISASPERLLAMDGQGGVSMRPIAGTLPRKAEASLEALAAFAQDPKERAEHIMLVDLIRNDLGRIAKVGSVTVPELLTIEHYRHVYHLVSEVRAHSQATPGEALSAVFPSGTITGCPKVRAIQILAECEQSPRGPYTGSLGYLNHDGRLDSNILIRSFWQEEKRLFWRTGAGIVADSNPLKELQETRAKALGLARALGLAF